MSLYLDASVIVPTLVEQAASAEVNASLLEVGDALIVSDFASAEVASAISRLVRMRFVAADAATATLRDFDVWRNGTTSGVDIQASDVRQADLFVRRFELGLRAPDALHAALCQRHEFQLATLDRRLGSAAVALGISVLWLGSGARL